MQFFGLSHPSCREIKDLKIFHVGPSLTKICSVLCLFAYRVNRVSCIVSMYMNIVHIDSSAYLETILYTANNSKFVLFSITASILSSYSSNMLRYFSCILHRCLNTFRVFSKYAGRMRNTQREIFTLNYAWRL